VSTTYYQDGPPPAWAFSRRDSSGRAEFASQELPCHDLGCPCGMTEWHEMRTDTSSLEAAEILALDERSLIEALVDLAEAWEVTPAEALVLLQKEEAEDVARVQGERRVA
jgi:hypothetical protein